MVAFCVNFCCNQGEGSGVKVWGLRSSLEQKFCGDFGECHFLFAIGGVR